MATAAAWMEVEDGARVALEKVSVSGSVVGLLADISITQTYRNTESKNIEAVYTFPLPLDAILLELTMELNGRTLKGIVQLRKEAEDSYEDAVEQGDTAVLLELAAPGLYTVNVANLMPDETATIVVRYAQLLRWQGDELRLQIPTTIAPRYGNPEATGLQGHQVPETTLLAGAQFSAQLRFDGFLAGLSIHSPSHPVTAARVDDSMQVTLVGDRHALDRDLILTIEGNAKPMANVLWARDGDQTVALASFRLQPQDANLQQSRRIIVVIDCSGSMSGDSIAQARLATVKILDELRPNDQFNLIAFGSTYTSLFPEPVYAKPQNIDKARLYAASLDASMGGTEMASALRAAYQQARKTNESLDVLLLTDGEIWEEGILAREAIASGARVFSVGVGSAVAEPLLTDLSRKTGGEAEFVVPREDMAEKIVRHFGRIHQPVAEVVDVRWPGHAFWQAPGHISFTFAGDTLHVCACLEAPPTGDVCLNVQFRDGSSASLRAEFPSETSEADWLPRVCTAMRLRGLEKDIAEPLAVEYQLITEFTSCALVAERAVGERAAESPVLRKIPQTLAAGWGGTGRAVVDVVACQHYSPSGPEVMSYRPASLNGPIASMGSAPKRIAEPALRTRRQVLFNFLSIKLRGPNRLGDAAFASGHRSPTTQGLAHLIFLVFPELSEVRDDAGLEKSLLSDGDLAISLVVVFGHTANRLEARQFRKLLKEISPPSILDTNDRLRRLLENFLAETVDADQFVDSLAVLGEP